VPVPLAHRRIPCFYCKSRSNFSASTLPAPARTLKSHPHKSSLLLLLLPLRSIRYPCRSDFVSLLVVLLFTYLNLIGCQPELCLCTYLYRYYPRPCTASGCAPTSSLLCKYHSSPFRTQSAVLRHSQTHVNAFFTARPQRREPKPLARIEDR